MTAFVEPWPIRARWRRCEAIRAYADTLPAERRRRYLRKVVRDYVAGLKQVGVSAEKIERERRDIERLLAPPPSDGGTKLPVRRAS